MAYVVVHRAEIDEEKGARFVLARLFKNKKLFPHLSIIFADGGYSGEFRDFVKKTFGGWLLQIVRKPMGIKRFNFCLNGGLSSVPSVGYQHIED